MKKIFFVLLVATLAGGNAHAASWFDALYTVSSSGSTVPQTEFSIDGPAPWLYADVAGSTGFVADEFGPWLSFGWKPVGATGAYPITTWGPESTDKLWLSPTAIEWDSKKALGNWTIDSYSSGVNLILIYGVGVGGFYSIPGDSTSFSVVSGLTVTPEPATMALFGLGAGALGLARRRRKQV